MQFARASPWDFLLPGLLLAPEPREEAIGVVMTRPIPASRFATPNEAARRGGAA
jgi:hypothetical protein